MREIKFRAYLTTQKKMVYFDLWDHDCTHLDQDCDFDEKTDVVMQYTGLKDKNGKEIYDGDIVNYQVSLVPLVNEVYVVEADRSCFVFRQPGDSNGACTYLQTAKLEIIGNIYENPELCPTS